MALLGARIIVSDSANPIGFNWRPEIGDPTFAGWLTVALYWLAAFGCHYVASAKRLRTPAREQVGWRLLCWLFVALGVNKQLDLQSALTEAGRVLARAQGWYEQRGAVQAVFILGVGAACLLGAAVLGWWARGAPAATKWALLGTTLVLGYVVVRAASFHHIDHFIGQRVLGFRWNWILEMGGISVVLFATWLRAREAPPQRGPARAVQVRR